MRVLELLCASIFDFFPLYLFLVSTVQSTPSIPAAAVAVFSSVHEGFESTAEPFHQSLLIFNPEDEKGDEPSVRQAGQEFFPVVSH